MIGDAKPTILVAEDSRTQAEDLRHLLEQQGYGVTVAFDGKAALEAARRGKPTLVITDIIMPQMDGYALCKAIKAEPATADTPVIILTVLSSMQEITRSLECGADHFVRKPYEPANLLSRIHYILSNRELRKGRKTKLGLEIQLAGKRHFISSEREQILDLLLSSYEEAIQVNEELKKREKQVTELNAGLQLRAAELEAANKELESFSYSVSHDLRGPLRAIDGYSQMLEEAIAPKLGSDERRMIATVRGNAQRMGRLIEDLLRLSRVGRTPLRVQRVDMTALAREALAELQPDAGALQCVVHELPGAEGDRALLRQVWINLLSNALKYSAGRPGPRVEVGGSSERGEAVYCVTDNGAGFDMQYAHKLFGAFQRLHSAEQFAGTGIGLSIVARIVSRHGGRVWAEGRVDEGAKFCFALPAPGGRA